MTNKTNTELSSTPDFIEKDLKNSGLMFTDSRRYIFNLLLKTQTPLTVAELYMLVHKKNPKIGIGIATVYRTIGLLEKMGYLSKLFEENTKSFRYKFYYNYNATNAAIKTHKLIKPIKLTKPIKLQKGFLDANLTAKQSIYNFKDEKEDLSDFEKIGKIQVQLNTWMNDLNKMKREKEFELEDMIKDFGKVDKVIELHHYDKSSLIQMLIDFQSEFNWLPKHILFYTSTKLDVPLTNIYSIASFYKFFNLEPRGKYSIIVCDGTACHVRGSTRLLQRIINILNIKPGDTTSDYKFTLDTVNCLGCCALGPVMVLDDKYYSNPHAKALEKLFKGLN